MRPYFHVRRNATSPPSWPWGWVAETSDGRALGFWEGWAPEPGCAPGARVEQYQEGHLYTAAGLVPNIQWRVVDAADRRVLFSIPNEDTAHALLAWLCPKE